jgi:hypothetical protein
VLAKVGYSPLLRFFGGTSPKPPAMGASPPWTPVLPTPVGLGFAGVLGSTRGVVANAGYSPPLLALWGDTPHNPLPWGLRPLDPPLPTIVGLGFACVLGPTRGGVANVGYSPLLRFLGGTSPKPLARGQAPWTPFAHPRRLRVRRGFGSHSWRAGKSGLLAPFKVFWGHIPQTPCQGASPPGPPIAHPRWLWVCRRFGSHSWRGCKSWRRPTSVQGKLAM